MREEDSEQEQCIRDVELLKSMGEYPGVKLTREQRDEILAQFDKEARDRDEAEEGIRQHAELVKRWEVLCPPLYAEDIDRSRLPCDRQLADLVISWRMNPIGMILLGPTGRGKTRLTWKALEVAHFTGKRIVAMDGIGFANEASAAAYSPEATERWMSRLTSPDILFIDDLAKRFTKVSGQLLFGLVERRISRRKPILITTNVTAEQLTRLIDDPELADPLTRRLREFCNPISI